ncbi:MAG: hypothetical protein ACOYL5_05315 [Phototrophicaceae bacterium]
MKREWTTDEILEQFTLLEDEQAFVKANSPHNRLGKALLGDHQKPGARRLAFQTRVEKSRLSERASLTIVTSV